MLVSLSKVLWIRRGWLPIQSYQVSWLGFDIDLLGGAVLVPKVKVEAITSLVSSAHALKEGTLFGEYYRKNHFLVPGWGPVSCFMTRSLYALLNQRQLVFE